MADMSPITLEQRLSHMEAELRKANERVRALSEWRRTTARVHVLTAAGVSLLLLNVVGAAGVGATQSNTIAAPFTVTGPNSSRMVVDKNNKGTGLTLSFYNAGGGLGLIEGISTDTGAGAINVQSPDGSQAAALGLDGIGDPYVQLESSGKLVAKIGSAGTDRMGLRFWNADDNEIVGLGNKGGDGYFVLSDHRSVKRVEAGTELNGDGAVKTYGPTGKCGIALAGISCMIVAR